jgi:tRNA pseudouridine-54 N-methylase
MAKQPGLLRFVLVFPTLPVSGQFHTKDLPGSGKRIDVLCRSLASCFDWGPTTWPKEKLQVAAIIGNQVILEIGYPDTKIPHGEVSWAMEVRQALNGNPSSYIEVKEMGLADYIDEILSAPNSKVWALDETGSDITDASGFDDTSNHSMLIGDHKGYNEETLAILANRSIYRISLGKTSYLGSHCIAAIIGLLERKVE